MAPSIQWREPRELQRRSFSKTVRIPGDSPCEAYLAYSDRPGPGVVLLHDSGEAAWCRDVAGALEEQEGFTALVPDLSGGSSEAAIARAVAGARHLADNWHPRVGIVGFGWGAEVACAAAGHTTLDGLVLHHGLGPLDEAGVAAPVLGIFGERDPALDAARLVFERLVDGGVEAELLVAASAGHGFAEPGNPDYDEGHARSAQEAVVEFLHYNLS